MIDLEVPNDRGYVIVPWRVTKLRMHCVCVLDVFVVVVGPWFQI